MAECVKQRVTILNKGQLTYKDFIVYPSRGIQSVTFDIKSIPNWDQLTVNNVAILYAGLNPLTDSSAGSLNRSYSNGVVTVSIGGTIGFDTPGTGVGVAIRVFYVEF